MTYSILARDARTGEMGIASQSQAFAVGHSVPWAMAGVGVIATQSMGEPAYGNLGLDVLWGGLTASEALIAIKSIDPHPERRQVAMIDRDGKMSAYTGSACIAAAGHHVGENCVTVANMMRTEEVWKAMVDAFERSSGSGSLAPRLLTALRTAEDAGGDFRGQRSAVVKVVRATRSGRPWRDDVIDLRVDDQPAPLDALDRLVDKSGRYNRVVSAFERALDGQPHEAADDVDDLPMEPAEAEPDLLMWRAAIFALAGREKEAALALAQLKRRAPVFVEVFRRLETAGVVDQPQAWRRVLPPS